MALAVLIFSEDFGFRHFLLSIVQTLQLSCRSPWESNLFWSRIFAQRWKVACMINVCGFLSKEKIVFVWVTVYTISNQRFADLNMSEKYRFIFQMTSWSSKETSWLDQSKIKSHCFRMYKVPTLHFLWKRKLKFKWISPHCVFCMYFNIRIHPGQISKKCIKCMNEQRVCVTY